MVNRRYMLPAQIKKLSLSLSAFFLKLWGAHLRYCCIFTRLYISIPESCEPKVEIISKVERHALIRRHNCLLLCILPPCCYSFIGFLMTFALFLLFFCRLQQTAKENICLCDLKRNKSKTVKIAYFGESFYKKITPD